MLSAPGGGHSPQAEVARIELEQELRGLQPKAPTVPIFSTVTGLSGEQPTFDAEYWGRNVRQRVRFSETIARLAKQGHDIFLELSPQPILSAAIVQCLSHHQYKGNALPSLRRKKEYRTVMLGSLGQLYKEGYPVDWSRIYPEPSQHVTLPSYPWQRQRYWIEDPKMQRGVFGKAPEQDAMGRQAIPCSSAHIASSVNRGTHYWEMDLGTEMLSGLGTHRIRGTVLLSAAAYMEIASPLRQMFSATPPTHWRI